MNVNAIALIIIAVFVPLAAYAAYKWWQVFNSPDGERYRKRRMQGPFLPLSREDIDSDAARRR